MAHYQAQPTPNFTVSQTGQFELTPSVAVGRAASNDNRASDIRFDQYYTREDVAASFYAIFQQHFDPNLFLMVEPSAGAGSFFKLLPAGSLAYDVDPKHPGIETADFLTVEIPSDREVAIIGNPPFGKNASMAVRFFNRAARQASVIALILPRSIRKASIENRLDRAFHLIREEVVPDHAFLFRSKPYDVTAVFQIWVRRSEPRAERLIETSHTDFEFTTAKRADFAIQRVGARAGRIHHDFTRSPSSHYFIRGPVEAIMTQLDFASVVGNVAGNPSLARSEIISLYREWMARNGALAIRHDGTPTPHDPPHGEANGSRSGKRREDRGDFRVTPGRGRRVRRDRQGRVAARQRSGGSYRPRSVRARRRPTVRG